MMAFWSSNKATEILKRRRELKASRKKQQDALKQGEEQFQRDAAETLSCGQELPEAAHAEIAKARQRGADNEAATKLALANLDGQLSALLRKGLDAEVSRRAAALGESMKAKLAIAKEIAAHFRKVNVLLARLGSKGRGIATLIEHYSHILPPGSLDVPAADGETILDSEREAREALAALIVSARSENTARQPGKTQVNSKSQAAKAWFAELTADCPGTFKDDTQDEPGWQMPPDAEEAPPPPKKALVRTETSGGVTVPFPTTKGEISNERGQMVSPAELRKEPDVRIGM